MSDRSATRQKAPSWAPVASGLLQRRCACGGHTTAGGECEACRRKRQSAGLQPKLAVNEPGDAFEQEADRLAAAVVHGAGPVPPGAARCAPAVLHRQEPPKEKSNEEKAREAAAKVGEAFLKTPLGQQIKDEAASAGETFVATLPGKIITGTAAAGAITAIVATNSELPVGIPEIPLDVIHPGLKMKITYEGPVQKPTAAAISFSGSFGGAPPAGTANASPSDADKYRAATTRIARDQQRFREGLKTPAERAEDKLFWDAYGRMRAHDPLNPLRLIKPGGESTTSLTQSPLGPPPPPGLKLPPKPKLEDDTLQRKSRDLARQDALSGGDAPASVYDALASSGRPLEPRTRAWMQARFGYDFSAVRVHTGEQAEVSARGVNALAYTVGRDVVFAAGQYAPDTTAGRLLLAHELVHTIQQGAAHPLPAPELRSVEGSPEPALRSPAADPQPVRASDPESVAAALPPAVPVPAPLPAPLAAARLQRKKAPQGNPAEEQAKQAETKKLKQIHVEELDEPAIPPNEQGRVRRFGFTDPYQVPPNKGKGPKARPVKTVWQERAEAKALEAHMGVLGTPAAVLKQDRDVTQTLRAIWLTKVGWPQEEAHERWRKTGEALGFKALGFKREGGKAATAQFSPTQAGGKTCHFDHIVELQFSGTGAKENIQVLDPSPNMASGGQVRQDLLGFASDIKASLASTKGLEVVIVHFDAVSQDEVAAAKATQNCARIEQAAVDRAAADEKKAAKEPKTDEAGEVYKYPIKAGTATTILLTAAQQQAPNQAVPIRESPLIENQSAALIIPGAILETLSRAPAGGKGGKSGKGASRPDTVDAYLDTESRLPIKVDKNKKNSFKLNVDRETGELKLLEKAKTSIAFTYPFLSKGTITALDWSPEAGLSGEGRLRSDLPLLKNMDFRVAFGPNDFRIVAGIDPKKISVPIPGAKITRADLSLALMPQFDPQGVLAFDYAPGGKKLLDGDITIGKDPHGLMAQGKVRVYIPGVDAAEGTVTYSNREWSGGARIAASQLQQKLKYVQSGEVVVGFNSKGVDAEGKVMLAIPHTDGVEASIKRRGSRWILSGRGKFNPPRLDPVTIGITYDGDHIEGEAETGFTFHSLHGRLKVRYRDEKFSGDGAIDFDKGRARGRLVVSMSPQRKFSGMGSLTYKVTESLEATAGVKLDQDEKLTVMGALVFTKPIQLFKPFGDEYTLLKAGISIPIPGASIGPIGVKARIEGELKAGYQIGPGELQNARVEAVGNPLEEKPDLELTLGARLYVGARVSVSGSISGGIMIDVGIASASGGLTLTATATLQGHMASQVVIHYKGGRFDVRADFEVMLGLLLGMALTAWVKAEAGVGPFSVETRKDWELASRTFDTGLKLGLRSRKPLVYASDTGFQLPSISDIEVIAPTLDPQPLLKQSFGNASANEREL